MLFRGLAQFSSCNLAPDRILIIALKEDAEAPAKKAQTR
jgi:hypothetical protein